MKNEKLVEQLKDKITAMIGCSFIYGGKTQQVESFAISESDETVKIQTSIRHYERSFEAIDAFLGELKPVTTSLVVSPTTLPATNEPLLPEMTINSSTIHELKDVLMDNIKKLRENKDYIPQAEAVKKNVESIIELAKVEVSWGEMYLKARGKK